MAMVQVPPLHFGGIRRRISLDCVGVLYCVLSTVLDILGQPSDSRISLRLSYISGMLLALGAQKQQKAILS